MKRRIVLMIFELWSFELMCTNKWEEQHPIATGRPHCSSQSEPTAEGSILRSIASSLNLNAFKISKDTDQNRNIWWNELKFWIFPGLPIGSWKATPNDKCLKKYGMIYPNKSRNNIEMSRHFNIFLWSTGSDDKIAYGWDLKLILEAL